MYRSEILRLSVLCDNQQVIKGFRSLGCGTLPGESLHLPLLPLLLHPGLEDDDLHQAEVGGVHLPAGQVLHLHVELDQLPADVAGPVGVEAGRDGAGLPAETAQVLLVSDVAWKIFIEVN